MKENIFLSIERPIFEIQPFDLFSKIVREQQNPRAKHSFCFFCRSYQFAMFRRQKVGNLKIGQSLFTYLVTGTNIHPYLESKRLSIVVLMDKIYYSFVKTLYVVKTHLVR